MAKTPAGNWIRYTDPALFGAQVKWHRFEDNAHRAPSQIPEMSVTMKHGNDGEPVVVIEQDGHTLEISDLADFLAQVKAHGTDRIKLEPEVVMAMPIEHFPRNVLLELREDGSITWKGKVQ